MNTLFKIQSLMSLRPNIQQFNVNVFWRNMCISKFVPLNLNPDAAKKQEDIEKLQNLSVPRPIGPTKEELLSDILDSNETAVKLLNSRIYLKKISPTEMNYRIKYIKENASNFILPMDTKFWMNAFRMHTKTFVHRFRFLKEAGLPITKETFIEFPKTKKMTVKDLQHINLVLDPNFAHKIFCELEAPQRILDSLPPLKSFHDKTLDDLWSRLSLIFMNWQLGIEENYFLKDSNKKKFQICSFYYMLQNINILKKYFELDNEKIVRNLHLLYGSPTEYMKFYEKKQLCGVDINLLLNRFPSILNIKFHNVEENEHILNFVNAHKTSTHPVIFTYAEKTIIERIVYFVNKTSLDDFRLTPNNVLLILMKDVCTRSFEDYEPKGGNIILIPNINFLKRKDYIPTTERSLKMLANSFLEWHLNISKKDSYIAYKQIGLINFPDSHIIKQNFAFLLNNGFTLDDIRKAFHIILYPHDIVVENFNNLSDAKYANLYKQTNDIDKLLQLLLYRIDKTATKMGISAI